MKKELYRTSFILALIVIFISVSPVAMAGTVGNPTATVKEGSFRLGVEIDSWTRDMEDEYGGEGEVEGTKILVNGTYGISEKIDIFAKIGMADAKIDDLNFDSDMEISYGIGGKVNVYEKGQIKAGVVAQILFWSGEDSPAPGIDVEVDATEFDLAVGGTYEVSEAFKCYGGLMYAMVSGDVSAAGLGSFDFDEADPIGIFIGGEFAITPQAKAGLEVRLVSETSFTLMASFAF